MIAWLGMYDMPHLHAANDAFWEGVRGHLAAANHPAPRALDRSDRDIWSIWRHSDLVLGQTCGLPFQSALHGATKFVGTPDYGLPDCPPGYYFSEIMVRAADPRRTTADFAGALFAYNDPDSNSGWSLPRRWAMQAGLRLKPHLQTGSHLASALAVAEGRADMMGIDAHTHRLLREAGALPRGLRVLDRTEAVPGLPFICAVQMNAEAVRNAVKQAIAELPEAHRRALHLHGLTSLSEAAYLEVALR